MAKKMLTDRGIQALKPARAGTRYEVMDAVVPGLGVRVTERGHKSFVLITRYPGDQHPARRAIGEYGRVSLEEARTTARSWHDLIRRGVDPKAEAERQRLAALREQASAFSLVASRFLARIADQRRAGEVERVLRRVLVPRWGDRSVASITRSDVVELVMEINGRGKRYRAHSVFGVVRSLFNWAVEVGDYGLETSPCDRIRPKALIGEKKPRQRVLTDEELRAFWKATARMGFPYGPMLRLLLLTGCRKSEVAEARWSEVDMEKRLLTIPEERFKSGSPHLVPLTDAAVDLIELLPHFACGDFLFSLTSGEQPINDHSGAKEKLDQLMAQELGRPLDKPFVIHDLRRTVRTNLSALRVPDNVGEKVIGHGSKGMQRVYDQHRYVDEIRDALELWAGRLRDIVEPPPRNVVKMRTRQ